MSTSSPTPRFLTAAEAAKCIGITKSTMYDWVNRGYLPHHRLGRLVRIEAADLEGFIQGTRLQVAPLPGRAMPNEVGST